MADNDKTVTYDPLIELMARFENVRATDTSVDPFAGLTIEDALKKHIVDGIKKNLEARLEVALQTYEPLQVVNDILLDGMKTVGELFGAGKMQLPFVLQSAEVMKAAVRYLEPKMEKAEGSERGSMLIATVAGDVHDIGKNLVDIILSNNGYRVVNIGIKQTINAILDAAVEHKCDVIGMSGLLVKSTLIMKENLEEMNARGLSHYPVVLGGAALTRGYVEEDLRRLYKGQVFYAQDAFEGLKVMGEIAEGGPKPVIDRDELDESAYERVASHRVGVIDAELYKFDGVKSDVQPSSDTPELPFYGARKATKFDVFELYKYVNKIALYRGQWQFKRDPNMDNSTFNGWLSENVDPIFARIGRELASVLKPAVKWGYFPCASEGNDLVVFADDYRTERTRFTFPRQRDGKRLCLADFFKPIPSNPRPETLDTVGFQIVTVGGGVTVLERSLFDKGEFQDYLFVHGMGVECAEALAEYWHRQVRLELGFADDEPDEMRLLFSARYRGSRYSFGYPACPNLEDQTKLFELLSPGDIGVELTEQFMLSPEQSTSAIIVHHPAAKYFNVR